MNAPTQRLHRGRPKGRICVADAMNDATVSMEQVGGRTLRTAAWRLDQPSEHLPILFFNGIGVDATAALGDTIAADQNEVVILKDIEFVSMCEHHLLPFTGVAHIAYLPAGRVVGLGRLPKVVEIVASRPQLQENLTAQIADAIEAGTGSAGVVVVIEARHHCVVSRGARQPEANTITMAARGAYAEPIARAEVMALISK